MARNAPLACAVIATVLLAAAVAPASAAPCIECRDCRTNNCWSTCRDRCPTPPPLRPDNIIVSGDACKRAGTNLGPVAAKSACDTARRYCNGGQAPMARSARRIGPTTLSQCSNIAMGACQQNANNARIPNFGHPCASELNRGFRQCTAQQFRNFYEGETADLCTNLARDVTGVQPGTNQWARPGRRHLLEA